MDLFLVAERYYRTNTTYTTKADRFSDHWETIFDALDEVGYYDAVRCYDNV